MGIFTENPSVPIETTDIYPEPQYLASYDKEQVESTANIQGEAVPADETWHTRPTEDPMTPTKQGYDSSDSNNKSNICRITTSRGGWCHK